MENKKRLIQSGHSLVLIVPFESKKSGDLRQAANRVLVNQYMDMKLNCFSILPSYCCDIPESKEVGAIRHRLFVSRP